jgi:hypothetical protein
MDRHELEEKERGVLNWLFAAKFDRVDDPPSSDEVHQHISLLGTIRRLLGKD